MDRICFTATVVGSFHLSSSWSHHSLMGPARRASFPKVGEGFSVLFHGGDPKALSHVGFDFLFITKLDSVLDTFGEVVDIPDAGIGAYPDDISLAF